MQSSLRCKASSSSGKKRRRIISEKSEEEPANEKAMSETETTVLSSTTGERSEGASKWKHVDSAGQKRKAVNEDQEMCKRMKSYGESGASPRVKGIMKLTLGDDDADKRKRKRSDSESETLGNRSKSVTMAFDNSGADNATDVNESKKKRRKKKKKKEKLASDYLKVISK